MRYLILIAILLSGCGQDQSNNLYVDISNTKILWQGAIEQDQPMRQIFDNTKSCMQTFGFLRIGQPPNVVITEHGFYCNGTYRDACIKYNENIIYIVDDFSCHSMFPLCVTDIDKSSLRHELIHWITGKGDADHNTDYMKICAPSLLL